VASDPIARFGRAVLLSMLVLPLAAAPALADADPGPVPMLALPARAAIAPVLACDAAALRGFDRLPEAPTEITGARLVAEDGARAAHCLVSGYVWPQVKFELRLPTRGYTGRYLQIGCGGNCGFIRLEPSPRCDDAMAAGGAFAVAASDAGHTGSPSSSLWARDNRALQDDFAERSVHVVSVASKAIIAAFYGRPPERAYFQGCSDGGREAMKEAQRFPGDFDGIVAGAPANYITSAFLKFAWQAAKNRDAAGKPILTGSAVKTLHAAVMRACDGLDGLADGQIDDPRACKFDPATLACPGDAAERPGVCLGRAQVDTASAFYSGPVDAGGHHLSPGGQSHGSELTWAERKAPAAVEGYFSDMIYGSMRPGGVRLADFKFRAEEALEIRQLGAHYDAFDPDIRAFRDRGGKMIVWEGAADPSAGPNATLAYYQDVRELLGGMARTRDTMRVFMLPGVYHCRGGTMPYEANFLGAIVNWVEAGIAPDSVIAAAVKPEGGIRTRPVFAYPVRAQYSGKGSVDEAASFRGLAAGAEPDDHYPWVGAGPTSH
jgi:hypothetical protein